MLRLPLNGSTGIELINSLIAVLRATLPENAPPQQLPSTPKHFVPPEEGKVPPFLSATKNKALVSCFMLLALAESLAFDRAELSDARTIVERTPMIAITTRSSMSVNP